MQLYLMPNFHYDVTWHKDMSTFMRLSADILLEVLDLLEREPGFRYTLDHVTFIEGFLALHPEERGRLRRQVDEGRIELVGGMYSMMDCDMPDGEAFARQLLYGQRWLERTLGRRARVGWFLDNYGFTAQLPQLLQQGGMDAVEICLWWAPDYMAEHMRHSEFWWQGLDGTRLLTHVAMPNYNGPRLPGARGYWETAAPFDPAAGCDMAEAALADFAGRARRWSAGRAALIHIGGDFARPNPRLPEFVACWNERRPEEPALIATPSQFFAAVAAEGAELPVYRGEIGPAMRTEARSLEDIRRLAEIGGNVRPAGLGRFGEGYGEAKSERKQLDRRFSNRARTAEKAAVIASWLGGDYSPARFEELYRPVMVFQHHDPFIGCCVAPDYERVLETLRRAIAECEAIASRSLERIAARVDSRGPGRPVLAFNPHAWPLDEVVAVDAEFDPGEARALLATDDAGAHSPVQPVDVALHPDGSIARARALFTARLPALGHRLYHLRPAGAAEEGVGDGEAALESDRFRLELAADGTIARLHDKTLGVDVLAPQAAEIVIEEDLGCFCHIDTTGRVWRQGLYPHARVQVLERGPLRWRARVSNEHKGCSYVQEISLHAGSPRIDFDLRMDIRSGEDLRARLRLPSAHPAESLWAETPYGAIERGRELAHAINWVDVPQPYGGLGLLNEGLSTYELTADALYLSLWRGLSMLHDSTSCLAREQMRPLLERGERRFRFALYPHAGDWRAAGLVRAGLAFNQPPPAVAIDAHAGDLPAGHSWLAVEPASVVLNVVKGSEDGAGLVLRLYEGHGEPAAATLSVPVGWRTWRQTTLLEEGGRPAPITGGRIELGFRPFEVKTVVLSR